jgi:hypothetical protein
MKWASKIPSGGGGSSPTWHLHWLGLAPRCTAESAADVTTSKHSIPFRCHDADTALRPIPIASGHARTVTSMVNWREGLERRNSSVAAIAQCHLACGHVGLGRWPATPNRTGLWPTNPERPGQVPGEYAPQAGRSSCCNTEAARSTSVTGLTIKINPQRPHLHPRPHEIPRMIANSPGTNQGGPWSGWTARPASRVSPGADPGRPVPIILGIRARKRVTRERGR